jgi:hypothetical protein
VIKDKEILPGTGTAVTLELAKKHLNIEADFTDDDELIGVYIDAAVQDAENYTGHPLFQIVKVYLNNFLLPLVIPAFADASVTEVTYAVDNGGVVTYEVLPEVNYQLSKLNNSAVDLVFKGDDLPALLPDNDKAVIVELATSCPSKVKAGILLRIGDLYLRREDRATGSSSTAVLDLWRDYRSNWK